MTRRQLVESATRRFYRDGFRMVGLDQILQDVGISKTAFYKHFSCKDDLMIEVLEEHNRWVQRTFSQMIRQIAGDSPRRQLEALFDVAQHMVESDDFKGCIFVNAAIEFPLPHDPAHQAAARNKLEILEMIRRIAEGAGATEPQGLAEELCLLMEGAYVTRHVTDNRRAVEIARRAAAKVIRSYLKGPMKAKA
jgi:AcrR family transcriptional regulator